VTERAPALFDADALRHTALATVGVPAVAAPTIVLGSRQDAALLDAARIGRDGIGLRRRRGGGGAVLLRPGDCWVELWLPAISGPVGNDVRVLACRVGDCWRAAFEALGVRAEVHRGGVERADQGAIACFAGLGPGELTVGGAKLVGLSQWRVREGVLISSVVPRDAQRELAGYLVSPWGAPSLLDSACLEDPSVGVAPTALADGFVDAVRHEFGELVVRADPFR
jgi:lipoate-protein ligase A